MPNLPSLKSLAELPDVPSPVLALVGAGDAAAEKARELPSKIAAIDPKSLDPRGREVEVDLAKLDPRSIDLTSLSRLDPRTIDTAALTATGLQWAAKGQEAYESLVARGELVISKSRESEWADATGEASNGSSNQTPVAEPPAAKKTAKPAVKKTAPKASDTDV
jgi:hypothetical protein